jgi:cytochrome c oxidase cbb3-type subunit 3/ubiquinol-cytochrome c reductase cytochrome c subunit
MRLRLLGSAGLCAFFAAAFFFAGCGHVPGRPGPGPQVVRPEQVLDFPTLYQSNCAGCHGANGSGGPAISLANPVYLAVAGEDAMRDVIAKGVRGKLMPPFARSAGGMLTDKQVDVLVHGMLREWAAPVMLSAQNLPPYKSLLTGDAGRGQQQFGVFCASCHGANGEGHQPGGKDTLQKTGSIVDPAYLDLISDQGLRSVTIAGRRDQGMPDWRGDARVPMTDQQITDIVAWIASKRTANPGQPYPVHP